MGIPNPVIFPGESQQANNFFLNVIINLGSFCAALERGFNHGEYR